MDLSAAAEGTIFTNAEWVQRFDEHEVPHGNKPNAYTLLMQALGARLIKPADVVATLEARARELGESAPNVVVSELK
ncbi:hypothetical protein CDCA_CDCA14G3881 [Cyanidium caldarium]|uniref:Uncharacterized protein n=1 Tax=Cyanidium caldarium TaxID=2771 RepID=A0AAV9IQW4_CYACA|nr:hypothetical protein CDCA_CDCA02G0486 [Cyanidium caldarium]KAK4537856.1 hypothetical protein CDCA_CDCA14G3881 [Cyanidium caldarium]